MYFIHRIKRLLSFFRPILLESVSSEYSDVLEVWLNKGRCQLCSAHAVYSYEDKYVNFYEAFRRKASDIVPQSEVLILGYGLGSIPYILEKKLHLPMYYTAVEIDPQVIHLADKYTHPKIISPVTTFETDAYVFLQYDNALYDLICIDLFIDDRVPEEFRTPDFLHMCKERLTSRGILIFNHLSSSKHYNVPSYYIQVFKEVFPQGTCIQTRYNSMLVSR